MADRRRLTDEDLVAAAWRLLSRRADVRAAAQVAERTGDAVLLTGGAVRAAFLAARDPHPPADLRRDLDVVLPPGRAAAFAGALGRRHGSRAIPIGAPPRRVLLVPAPGGEVDVWEREGSVAQDLLRRDFTVNALAFRLPGGEFLAPRGALEDLRRRLLKPPRRGVFLEDPLRVLRTARFLAELRGFHVAPGALPELRRAARRLPDVASERTLRELDRLLSARPRDAAEGLRFLEACGALRALLPGSTARHRRRGIRLVAGMKQPSPPVARILLLSPLGDRTAEEVLRKWKTPRRDRQLAGRLLAAARTPEAGARSRAATRESAVATLRAVSPFFEESVLFLSSFPSARRRRLAAALAALSADPRKRERILRPPRPLDAVAFLRSHGVSEGPRLGALLAALDLALAARRVRSRRGAERLLGALAAAPDRAAR